MYLENLNSVIYSAIGVLFAVVLAIFVSRFFNIKEEYTRNVYRYALTFGNSGFMGNAIVPLVLGGDEHLFRYTIYCIPINLVIYMWGLTILTPREKRNPNVFAQMFNFPALALVIGLVLGMSGIGAYLPDFVKSSTGALKNAMGPIAMIMTGYVVAQYDFKSLLTNKKVYVATFLRLFILPAVVLSFLKLCGASDDILTLSLFAVATPLGMNTVVFPAAFGGETKTGASMAMISHLLSVISIPVMYTVLNYFLSL